MMMLEFHVDINFLKHLFAFETPVHSFNCMCVGIFVWDDRSYMTMAALKVTIISLYLLQ